MRLSIFLRDKIDTEIIDYLEKAGDKDKSDFIRKLLEDGIKYRDHKCEPGKLKIIVL